MKVPRKASELWGRLDVAVRDLPLGLLLLAGSFLPGLHSNGTELGGLPARPYDALAFAAIALQSLPLAVRRRWPMVCLALVVAGFALDQLRGYHTFAGTGLVIALFSAGAHLGRHRRTTLVVLSAAYLPLSVALDRLGGTEPVEGYVVFYLALALAWGIGAWLRTTRAAEAERRRLVAEATRAAERTTIARELHDVVTHHVTAMVVQAEAARYLTAAPERLDHTLTAVADTGRRAVTDLRHLLDLLDPGHGDQARTPQAGALLALVKQTREAGQPVEFAEEGAPAEPSGSADLVAYRVVQEALTNALKYAYGSPTSVRVTHGRGAIDVEVSTEDSPAPAAVGGSGRGLAGLRERVGILGGEFSAGPGGEGGFVVRARIPAGGQA